jgi:hypothetical protein
LWSMQKNRCHQSIHLSDDFTQGLCLLLFLALPAIQLAEKT